MKTQAGSKVRSELVAEVGGRLKEFLGAEELEPATVAATIGKNRATLYNAFSRHFLSNEALVLLARRYGLNLHWLLTGDGAPKAEARPQTDSLLEEGDLVAIPYFEELQDLRASRTPTNPFSFRRVPRQHLQDRNRAYATTMPDHSLRPLILKGWTLAVEPTPESDIEALPHEGGVYVVRTGCGLAVRWLLGSQGGWVLPPVNLQAGLQPECVEDGDVVGRVVYCAGGLR